ncbi:unnamed protein product [Gongylonema pulchrum]|uniref:HCO3_cotransp domain-containing protein n=1 Tax=Gongylonema pulchrum TaxID=637853 RepID=A0A183DBI9_9BILA|nr:unnamed protein product [Gongylonema pulchrum]
MCIIFGYIALFAIAFGGQTTASSNMFFILSAGTLLAAVYLVFDDVRKRIHLVDFTSADQLLSFSSWTAFCLGALNGLHLFVASPTLYQVW